MIKLLIKGTILIGILFAITFIANWVDPLPYHWGSIQLNTKVQFLKEKKINPSAYFIGSSNTLRHVIPHSFNQLIGKDSSFAFNFGVDGVLPPKSFHVLENLLKHDETIDYIFLEINGFDYLPEHYFIPTRRKYYYKFQDLWMSYRYLFSGNFSLKIKLGMTVKYMIAYIENAFKIGMRTDLIKFLHGKNVFGYVFLGKNKDGYYPLPGTHTKDEKVKNQLPAYTDQLISDFTTVYNNIETIDKVKYNTYLREVLLEQMERAEERNIKLYFLLNPVKCEFHEVADIVALFYSLPATNRIDMANPLAYPELYKLENRWDEGHLNDQGAKIYTQKLADAFNKLIK